MSLEISKGRASPESFEDVFRALIQESAESQAAFASRVGLSPGRLSQVVSGREPGLSYATLELLLKGLPRLDQRERLYRAWQGRYAPSPVLAEATASLETAAEIEHFLALAPHLQRLGQANRVARSSQLLWERFRQNSTHSRLALAAGDVLVQASLLLERYDHVPSVIAEMQRLALLGNDSQSYAEALWLRAVTTRKPALGNAHQAEALNEQLEAFLHSWRPTDPAVAARRKAICHGLVRDRLLNAIDLVDRQKEPSLVEQRGRQLETLLEEPYDEQHWLVGNEVLARALVKQGRFDEADRALEKASSRPPTENPFHLLKVAITKVELLALAGELHQASKLLERQLHEPLNAQAMHYYRKLRRLEKRLEK